MTMKKVFIILVALESKRFEYYYMDPQIYYDSFEEAYKIQERIILKGSFRRTQLRIQPLWIFPNNKN